MRFVSGTLSMFMRILTEKLFELFMSFGFRLSKTRPMRKVPFSNNFAAVASSSASELTAMNRFTSKQLIEFFSVVIMLLI